jgi:hypothetical protein
MTGDIKFLPNADIVIMTTEILRNLLYKKGSATENLGLTSNLSLENLDSVIFDEVHYINNKERGTIWEETLILLPKEINLVLLSATIAFLNTSRCQSVFAVPRRAFCAAVPLRLMSARKESPVSTSAYFAMVDKDVFESNTTFTWFWVADPFFVVMIITPFAAREPYNAVAAAPFNTLIEAISSGLISVPLLPKSI